LSAAELAAVLRQRFPQSSPDLEADLAACEEAVQNDTLRPKRGLALVQALDGHDKFITKLRAAKAKEE